MSQQPSPHDSQADHLIRTLESAQTELEGQGNAPPRTYAAGAIPPWLTAILQAAIQTFGPALAQALIQFLQQFAPQPQPTNTAGE